MVVVVVVVCLSHSYTSFYSCVFAAVGLASRRYRLVAVWYSAVAALQHGAHQQMRAVPHCQLM